MTALVTLWTHGYVRFGSVSSFAFDRTEHSLHIEFMHQNICRFHFDWVHNESHLGFGTRNRYIRIKDQKFRKVFYPLKNNDWRLPFFFFTSTFIRDFFLLSISSSFLVVPFCAIAFVETLINDVDSTFCFFVCSPLESYLFCNVKQ